MTSAGHRISRPVSTLASLVILVLLFQGCAPSLRVALEPPVERSPEDVTLDREECRAEARPSARQVAAAAGEGIKVRFLALAGGIAVGTALGLSTALDCACGGREGTVAALGGVAIGVAVGFVGGLVAGAQHVAKKIAEVREQAFEDCLKTRGYSAADGEWQDSARDPETGSTAGGPEEREDEPRPRA
jgi:ABC-type nitrate/sulfonate/bicarbonate transport system permease component